MARKGQMPEWLNFILQEFSRPPYFLQEGLEKHKDEVDKSPFAGFVSKQQSRFRPHPSQGRHGDSGTANPSEQAGAGKYADSERPARSGSPSSGKASSSATPGSGKAAGSRNSSSGSYGSGRVAGQGNSSSGTFGSANHSGSSSKGHGGSVGTTSGSAGLDRTVTTTSSSRSATPVRRGSGPQNGSNGRQASSRQGGASQASTRRKDGQTEDATNEDIVNTALQPSLKEDKAGPSANWGLVFRKAGIPVEIVKQYGWNVKRAAWKNGVVRVHTPKASFAIKSSYLSPARVEFLKQALAYVAEQGFTRFAPFVQTKDGRPCAALKDKVYYATRWQIGQPVNFSSEEQVAKVAEVLAQFHEKSRGFESDSYNPPMEFYIEGLLRRRTEDLKALLARAEMKREKDRFDTAFTSIANELRQQAEESVRLLDDPGVASFLQTDEEVPGLCHLDVIPSNFLFTPNRDVVAIDFDLCTYAPRALDLSHLLRRALQRQHWRTAVAYQVFVAYNDARPITGNEYALVQALLTFPYRAWRIANTRLRMGAGPGQIEEIEECVEEFKSRTDFLESFARQISRDA